MTGWIHASVERLVQPSAVTITKRDSLRTLGYHDERQEEAAMVALQAHTTVGNFGRIFRELRGPRSWIPQSER